MERNREGRRGNMAAVNGLSRRRPRASTVTLRDSPEEDGGMELQETGRLRDRGAKKDRDRDRSGRSKRRRGDRMLHGSNREEGDDSSEESMEEDEEEEDDDLGAAASRLPPPPPPPLNPSPPSSSTPSNHSNHRKSFPAKVMRPPAVWKVADEMIGVSVPRKARSGLAASAKRSHECWLSGSGSGAGTGEQVHRQAATSPSTPSPTTGAYIPTSPASSNASVRKKMKQISGTKHRPPKISKSPSSIQDIEIEVAEVLYGLTRQFPVPSKQDVPKTDLKDVNEPSNETKSLVSSPNSISPSPAISQYLGLPPQNFSTSAAAALPAVAPKRKKPRPVKLEDESSSTPSALNPPVLPSSSISSTSKAVDGDQPKAEVTSPKPEKNTASTLAENNDYFPDLGLDQVGGKPADVKEESMRSDTSGLPDPKPPVANLDTEDRVETKVEADLPAKEPASDELDVKQAETTAVKTDPVGDGPREKFKIDLMAPPPGKNSPEAETDFVMDHKSPVPEIEMGTKLESVKTQVERSARSTSNEEGEVKREDVGNKSSVDDFDSRKRVNDERPLDVRLEFGKLDNDGINSSKQPGSRQPAKVPKGESKQEETAVQVGSLPLPMPVAGWHGGLFGYMGQVPSYQAVMPMDGTTAPSRVLQQLRPKRCATHCYIAQNINSHQKIVSMNPFLPAAVGSSSIYGAKPYNLNAMPPSESTILGNPLQGGFLGRCVGSLQEKSVPVYGSLPGSSSKEKVSSANAFVDAAQRKQLVLQQPPQVGSTSNMLPAPAFIFPLNQPQVAVAAAAAAAVATSRTALVKSPNMNATSSSNASCSAVVTSGSAAASTATASFNYPNLPQGEAQYLLLQNNGYPFHIPAHVGAPYRVGNHPQAMPFLNGSFYASQMLHPPQLQQQPQHHSLPSQQGPHNTGTSSGSSSHKYPQLTQKAPEGGANSTCGSGHGASKQRQHLPPHPARQLECETASEDGATADSRLSQPQRGIYSHNFPVPIHQQNFPFMSSASALSTGASHNDKQPLPLQQQQHQNQQQGMKVEVTPQAFAMSFASFNGSAASVHHGFDFSSAGQNHAIFQSLPEVARNGYQFAAAAAAAQAAQHKKAQNQLPEDGKSLGESTNASLPDEEERKAILAGKASNSISQHSFSFSRPESDPSITTALGNNNLIDGSARPLNLTPASLNGGRAPNCPASAAPATTPATSFSGSASNAQHQQQQHMIHLQKQQQQQQQQQHQQKQQLLQIQYQQQLAGRAKRAGSSNSVDVYSERLSAGTSMPKFSNAFAGFPQAIQSGSPTQSPQWKNSARTAAPLSSVSNPTPHVKNHLPQQQGGTGTAQQCHSNPGHPTQISFGASTTKPSSVQQQQLAAGGSIPSSASAAVAPVGSPPSSVSKTAGGSPRTSAGSKTSQPNTSSQLQHLPSSRNSPASKSSNVSNRNVPSLLGQPHMTPSPASVIKSQQQQHQHQHQHQQLQQQQQQQQQMSQPAHQLQKQQPFPPGQLFFSTQCLPVQSSQSGAASPAAAGYYPRRPSELQQHQHQHPPPPLNSTSVSPGMLSLCPPLTLAGTSATSEPAKAVAAAAAAANSMKLVQNPALLQAAHYAAAAPAHSASGSPHSHMPAASFSYLHSVPSVPVKPAEQKPTAGT